MKRPQKLEKFNLIVLWKKKKQFHKRNLASLIMLGFPKKKEKKKNPAYFGIQFSFNSDEDRLQDESRSWEIFFI